MVSPLLEEVQACLVAIRYSQVRSDARPWKDSRFAHARRKVSWVRSCASSYDASIR